jgi:hypothetical protein
MAQIPVFDPSNLGIMERKLRSATCFELVRWCSSMVPVVGPISELSTASGQAGLVPRPVPHRSRPVMIGLGCVVVAVVMAERSHDDGDGNEVY